MVNDKTLLRIRGLIKTLNPGCKILETSLRVSNRSENSLVVVPLDVEEIIATGRYSEETSIKSSGWLKSIHDMSIIDNHGRKVLAPKPETEEYVLFPNLSILTLLLLDPNFCRTECSQAC